MIPESLIAEIAASVAAPVETFLLTSRTEADEILEQQRRCRVTTLQLCDRVSPDAHAELRESLPGTSLVQVVQVTGRASLAESLAAAERVDALLLDSGNHELSVKELGGTGRTHDWTLSARIVEDSPVPVFLAGGLTAANVDEAIREVRPYGVDLCTGVRTAGDLDEVKLRRFMEIVAGERRHGDGDGLVGEFRDPRADSFGSA